MRLSRMLELVAPALTLAALPLLCGCADSVVGPTGYACTLAADPSFSNTAGLSASDLQASFADARIRLVPTLPPSQSRVGLDAALAQLATNFGGPDRETSCRTLTNAIRLLAGQPTPSDLAPDRAVLEMLLDLASTVLVRSS
ncbi:MAG TPA: hypothetical protein VK688_06615 [Gemmatimonadales bacterium]|nr:hypothetical protein [Gemmatimonadales bacterium]